MAQHCPQKTDVNKTSATCVSKDVGCGRADVAACSESRPGRKLRPRRSCNSRQSQGNPHRRQAMSLERPQAQVSGTRSHRSLRPGRWAQAAPAPPARKAAPRSHGGDVVSHSGGGFAGPTSQNSTAHLKWALYLMKIKLQIKFTKRDGCQLPPQITSLTLGDWEASPSGRQVEGAGLASLGDCVASSARGHGPLPCAA